MKKAFSYDIKERIAVISRNRDGSKTLELNLRTPYLYPWGWAFVIGGAFGVGYAAGLILRLGQCAAW